MQGRPPPSTTSARCKKAGRLGELVGEALAELLTEGIELKRLELD